MVTIDCPFCDGPLPVEDAEPLRCDACSVELAFAADPAPPTEVALAA